MVIPTTVTLRWAKLMGKEFIPGQTVRSTMASGCKDSSKAMESGGDFLTTAILESGRSLRPMATEFILGKTETDMRENGTCVSNMELALTFSRTWILTPGNTKMENRMEKVNTLGRTEPLMWEISWVV